MSSATVCERRIVDFRNSAMHLLTVGILSATPGPGAHAAQSDPAQARAEYRQQRLSSATESSATRFPKNAEEYERMFEQVKNWGRWGPNDQLGAANLITDAKRTQALALAKIGRIVALAHPIL